MGRAMGMGKAMRGGSCLMRFAALGIISADLLTGKDAHTALPNTVDL